MRCIIIFNLIVATVFGLSGCSSVLYFPDSRELVYRDRIPIQPQDLRIKTTDGETLHAWYFRSPARPSQGLVVQFHGNGQNHTAHFMSAFPFLENGYDLLTFDYRGYGASSGTPTPLGTIEDGKAVLSWINENTTDLPVVILGQSLGGAIAMRSLEEMPENPRVRLLILDSTFASYRSVAKRVVSMNRLTWIFQPVAWLFIDNSASPYAQLSKLGPYRKLVVHGDRDRVVPDDLGRDLFAQLSEPKTFWSIQGGDHIDFLWREDGRYFRKLLVLMKSKE